MSKTIEDFKQETYPVSINTSGSQSWSLILLSAPYGTINFNLAGTAGANVSKIAGPNNEVSCRLNSNDTVTFTMSAVMPSEFKTNEVWKKLGFRFAVPQGTSFNLAPAFTSTVTGATTSISNITQTFIGNGTWPTSPFVSDVYEITCDVNLTSTGYSIVQGNISIALRNSGLSQLTFRSENGLSYTYGSIFGTLGIQQPLCFHPSTMIKTGRGEVKITELKSGDVIYDIKDNEMKVEYIAKHGYTNTFVKISKGAIKENVPTEDLMLTPGHYIWYDNKWTYAKYIVNNKDITMIKTEYVPVYSIIT